VPSEALDIPELSKKKPSKKTNSDALPEGWISKVDEKTGKTYYINKTLKKTQWERPGEKAPKISKSSRARATYATMRSAKHTIDLSSFDKEKNKDKDKDKEEALPDGWISKLDPNSGRTYYVNKALKKSQWEKPTSGPKKLTTASIYATMKIQPQSLNLDDISGVKFQQKSLELKHAPTHEKETEKQKQLKVIFQKVGLL